MIGPSAGPLRILHLEDSDLDAELIEAECRAAQSDDGYAPALGARPGWRDGVRATFRWAWEGRGPAPIEVAPA